VLDDRFTGFASNSNYRLEHLLGWDLHLISINSDLQTVNYNYSINNPYLDDICNSIIVNKNEILIVAKNTGFGKIDIGKMSVFPTLTPQTNQYQQEYTFSYNPNPMKSEYQGVLSNKTEMINLIKLIEIKGEVLNQPVKYVQLLDYKIIVGNGGTTTQINKAQLNLVNNVLKLVIIGSTNDFKR